MKRLYEVIVMNEEGNYTPLITEKGRRYWYTKSRAELHARNYKANNLRDSWASEVDEGRALRNINNDRE